MHTERNCVSKKITSQFVSVQGPVCEDETQDQMNKTTVTSSVAFVSVPILASCLIGNTHVQFSARVRKKQYVSHHSYHQLQKMIVLLPPPGRFCYNLCPFVVCLVCQWDSTKNYRTDFQEMWMGGGPE